MTCVCITSDSISCVWWLQILEGCPKVIEPARSDILEDVAQIAAQPMNRYGSDLPGQQHCKNASFALLKKYGHEGQDAMREAVGLGGWVNTGKHSVTGTVHFLWSECVMLLLTVTINAMALACAYILLPAARLFQESAWHLRTVSFASVVCCHVFILHLPLCATCNFCQHKIAFLLSVSIRVEAFITS
jgi:hypothetical protein